VRIRGDAEKGDVRLQDYFDELLSEDELLEKSAARLASHFDALIGGGEITEQ
jgi:hypothetical protein